MDADPKNALREAHDAYRRGDLERAQILLENVLKSAPQDIDALRLSGMCLLARGRHREAIEKLQPIAPQDPRIYQSLGIGYQALGQVTHAAQSFLKAIELMPEVAGNYIFLGRLMLEQGHSPNAVDCGREAVRLEPASPVNHLFLGQALTRMGIREEAEEQFRKAISLDPENPYMHRQLGFHLLASGEPKLAGDCFERSLALLPHQGFAYLGLAQQQKVTRSEVALVDRMEGALRQDGVRPEERSMLHYALGKAFDDLAEYGAAMTHFDEANRLAFELRRFREPFSREAAERRTTEATGVFTTETIESHRQWGNEASLPIFIVGMMRSGTTLVDQILSSHPDVGSAGEVPTWTTDGPNAIDYARATLKPKVLTGLASQYLQLLQKISPGSHHVTDKMPANFQMLGAIHIALPKAKIVHIRRNPIDSCLSIYVTPYSASPSFAHSKENIVLAYRHYLRMMELWRKVLPAGAMLEVEYEQLVSEPERVTREIIEYCGLEWNDACLTPEKNKRLVSTPSMAQVRQPVYRTSVERWKRYEPWVGPFIELLPGR